MKRGGGEEEGSRGGQRECGVLGGLCFSTSDRVPELAAVILSTIVMNIEIHFLAKIGSSGICSPRSLPKVLAILSRHCDWMRFQRDKRQSIG